MEMTMIHRCPRQTVDRMRGLRMPTQWRMPSRSWTIGPVSLELYTWHFAVFAVVAVFAVSQSSRPCGL